jgi:hypothetical protein
MVATWLPIAAYVSAVSPSSVVSSTLAPFTRRRRAISTWPLREAVTRARVHGSKEGLDTGEVACLGGAEDSAGYGAERALA